MSAIHREAATIKTEMANEYLMWVPGETIVNLRSEGK